VDTSEQLPYSENYEASLRVPQESAAAVAVVVVMAHNTVLAHNIEVVEKLRVDLVLYMI